MKRRLLIIMIFIILLQLLSDCGGGGGGGGGNNPQPQPTTATVKLLTSGTLPAGTKIGGVQISVMLPAGVSVASTANPPETDAGAVVGSGNASNSTVLATYDSASHKVMVFLINANGFDIGEYATVNCSIAAGYYPTQADIGLTGNDVKDLNGVTINGITVGFNADIR